MWLLKPLRPFGNQSLPRVSATSARQRKCFKLKKKVSSRLRRAEFEQACPFLNGLRRVRFQKNPDRFPSPFSSQQRARWTAASLRTGDLGLTIRAVLLQIFASSAVMRRIHEKTTFQAVEKSTLHRSMPSIASAAPSSP